MTARRRRNNEEFGDYRESLKHEAEITREKIKGKWVWRSSMPMPDDPTKRIKLPPFRKPKDESSTED